MTTLSIGSPARKALTAALAATLLTGCQATGAALDVPSALEAHKLEIQVDGNGRRVEIEYHLLPSQVPQAVRDAMDALHPGEAFSAAEKEWNDGVLYYELTRVVGGFEIEALFTPAGVLFSEEIQVAASSVPQAIRDAVTAGWPDGAVKAWEEIRDARRALVEYHVKLDDGDRQLKVIVSLEGHVSAVFREMDAEIEVPIG